MKESRQAKILEIIAQRDIETQNQLMDALKEQGVHSTQATLSRDIKQLRLVKELSPRGNYRYVAAGGGELSGLENRLRTVFRESVLSYAVAQNLVILKTLPGMANAACSALDSMHIPHLVGSLAGDDTAFLAMEDNAAANQFCKEIAEMI